MSNCVQQERDAILRIAQTIRESRISNKEEHFFDIYKNFSTRYPMLYKMCCEPDFDIEKLKYMLNLMANVEGNVTSYEEATKVVGQTLYDLYVDPVVKEQKPSTEKKEVSFIVK